MNPKSPLIRHLTFEGDAVIVEYVIPAEDFKRNGVTVNHSLLVPAGEDYDDEIENLQDAALALLRDVLEDLPALDGLPATPPADQEEDDDDDAGDDDTDDD